MLYISCYAIAITNDTEQIDPEKDKLGIHKYIVSAMSRCSLGISR